MVNPDAVVIGGGFYGLRIAQFLREEKWAQSVVVLERESQVMTRASLRNQARIHHGYHYPRSILTGFRSRTNLPRFMSEFADAVDSSFDHLYAIATRSSKVNARQFEQFVARIGAPLAEASREELSLFAPSMVQKVYRAVEPAFDATVVRDILLARLSALGGVEIRTEVEVREVVGSARGDLQVVTDAEIFQSARVISALYASINPLHARSALPLIDFQQESTEMALVSVPPSLSRTAITVMDGPFFSLMPYPSLRLHTLSHVRYTPRRRWRDGPGVDPQSHTADSGTTMTSAFPLMQADAKRFLPLLDRLDYRSSLWETKTVLPQSDHDDSRPILFRPDHGVKGYTCIMGGKLDNVYDVLEELDEHRG